MRTTHVWCSGNLYRLSVGPGALQTTGDELRRLGFRSTAVVVTDETVAALFGDKIELRASVRYTGVGDVDLSTGLFDADTLFGVGFGYELIRGLSITGDFESGEFSSWNIGFRLDLDED